MSDSYRDRYSLMDAAQLTRLLRQRDKQMITQTKFWVRAAEESFAGNDKALRLRVEMAKAEPVEVVLS